MSKGSSAPTQSTVTNTDLPEYAEPYVERMFQRAETESKRAYEPYTGQRLAEADPLAQTAERTAINVGPGIHGMHVAQVATAEALADSAGIANLGPSNFSQFDYSGPGRYTGGTVDQYMSPYMQNVVDRQKKRAILDFNRAQAGRDAQAVQAGAFGGSRQAVVDALAQEELSRGLGDIQAQGLQDAFTQGNQMFELDRQARQNVERSRAAELARVQGATDQSRLAFGQLGLGAYGLQADLANELVKLGSADRAASLEYADVLSDIAAGRQADDQQRLDLQYQDFLRQQMYPQEQLQFYSDILRGNIRGSTMTTQQFQQANPFKDVLGAGIAGLSVSNLGST